MDFMYEDDDKDAGTEAGKLTREGKRINDS